MPRRADSSTRPLPYGRRARLLQTWTTTRHRGAWNVHIVHDVHALLASGYCESRCNERSSECCRTSKSLCCWELQHLIFYSWRGYRTRVSDPPLFTRDTSGFSSLRKQERANRQDRHFRSDWQVWAKMRGLGRCFREAPIQPHIRW
jgi:hypothetical protein